MHSLTRHAAPLAALAFIAIGCSRDATLPTSGELALDHAATGPCANDPAPAISAIVASPNRLWPPNHKMVSVRLSYNVADANLTGVSLRIASNEPVNGLGDGNTAPDWSVVSVSPTAATAMLRAERSGTGSGRIYTLTVVATDACGHETTRSVTVVVPHDQRSK